MRQGHTDPVELAAAAAALGEGFQAIGEHAAAEDVLRPAVAALERAGVPGDARLAAALSALGAVCAARGRLDEAERLYRRALRLTATPSTSDSSTSSCAARSGRTAGRCCGTGPET